MAQRNPFVRNFYRSLAVGTLNGHPLVTGATPAQRRKWRREAGLGDDPTLQNPPDLSWPEYNRLHHASLQRYPKSFFEAFHRLKNEALFRYMSEGEERVGSGASKPHQI